MVPTPFYVSLRIPLKPIFHRVVKSLWPPTKVVWSIRTNLSKRCPKTNRWSLHLDKCHMAPLKTMLLTLTNVLVFHNILCRRRVLLADALMHLRTIGVSCKTGARMTCWNRKRGMNGWIVYRWLLLYWVSSVHTAQWASSVWRVYHMGSRNTLLNVCPIRGTVCYCWTCTLLNNSTTYNQMGSAFGFAFHLYHVSWIWMSDVRCQMSERRFNARLMYVIKIHLDLPRHMYL